MSRLTKSRLPNKRLGESKVRASLYGALTAVLEEIDRALVLERQLATTADLVYGARDLDQLLTVMTRLTSDHLSNLPQEMPTYGGEEPEDDPRYAAIFSWDRTRLLVRMRRQNGFVIVPR